MTASLLLVPAAWFALATAIAIAIGRAIHHADALTEAAAVEPFDLDA